MNSETWSLIVGALVGLGAAWGPIALTNRAEARRRRAALAAIVLAQSDRMFRASERQRRDLTAGKDSRDTTALDGIAAESERATYELFLLTTNPSQREAINDMLEATMALAGSTPPHTVNEASRQQAIDTYRERRKRLKQALS